MVKIWCWPYTSMPYFDLVYADLWYLSLENSQISLAEGSSSSVIAEWRYSMLEVTETAYNGGTSVPGNSLLNNVGSNPIPASGLSKNFQKVKYSISKNYTDTRTKHSFCQKDCNKLKYIHTETITFHIGSKSWLIYKSKPTNEQKLGCTCRWRSSGFWQF